jgi:hypothetical protein
MAVADHNRIEPDVSPGIVASKRLTGFSSSPEEGGDGHAPRRN